MALILQLDSQGQPTKWITWQDAVTYHAKGLVSWSLGEVETVVHGGNNRVSGERSVIKTSSIIAIKGEVGKRKFRTPTLNNRELFRRDRHLCAYCGHKFKESALTRDHIIPRAQNGKDTWMNTVTACGRCNQRKDDRTPEQAGMQLLYAPYVPSRAEHLILANRQILSDQMEFLLAFVDENSRVKEYLKNDAA